MRASVFVGTSLDGFIARKNGSLDFLPTVGGDPNGYADFVATIDACIIGRKTYEWILGWMRRTGGSWPYEKPVIVLSHNPGRVRVPKAVECEVLNCTPKQAMALLEMRKVRHVYVDGGRTIQAFLSAGLIDRIIINRYPVLIGQGVPLFGEMPHDVRLRHVSTQAYPRGLVKSEYRVVRAGQGRKARGHRR